MESELNGLQPIVMEQMRELKELRAAEKLLMDPPQPAQNETETEVSYSIEQLMKEQRLEQQEMEELEMRQEVELNNRQQASKYKDVVKFEDRINKMQLTKVGTVRGGSDIDVDKNFQTATLVQDLYRKKAIVQTSLSQIDRRPNNSQFAMAGVA